MFLSNFESVIASVKKFFESCVCELKSTMENKLRMEKRTIEDFKVRNINVF